MVVEGGLMSNSRLFGFISILLLIGGCTRTVQHRVAGYYPGAAPTTQQVPKTAIYSIRFLDEKGKKTGGIPDSHRLLAAGEHAGFDVNEEKGLVAVAGNTQFPITIPAGYGAVWSATYHKPTQFSKEMAKAATGVGKAIGNIAAGTIEGFLNEADEDEMEEEMDAMFGRMNQHLDDQRRLRNRSK
jgi:hypothetical protein